MEKVELVIATSNEGKFQEIAAILEDLHLKVYPLFHFSVDPLLREDGLTLGENAAVKAKAAAQLTGRVALADDSGLEIDVLGGCPGIHSARFAGEKASDQERNARILKLLQGIPPAKRGATFRCVIAIAEPEGPLYFAEGAWRGVVASCPRGTGGFGYDSLFELPEYGCTVAELSFEVKNQISHRAKALREAKMILRSVMEARGKSLFGA